MSCAKMLKQLSKAHPVLKENLKKNMMVCTENNCVKHNTLHIEGHM